MENEEGSLDRAVSSSGNWYLGLSPIRKDGIGRREITGIYCEDPSSVSEISSMFPEFFRETTPVFKVSKDNTVQRLGSLTQVLTSTMIAKDFVEDKPDITDLFVDNSEAIPIDTTELLDAYEFNAPKSKVEAFNECTRYELLFENRKELGLSVDYFKDKHGKQQFRYRMKKKEGVLGGWTAAKYVREAVAALKEYDKLLDEGSWVSLRKAERIAEKYFTEKEKYNALSMIDKELNYQATRLIGHARSGLLDDSIAKQVYSRLIMSKELTKIREAVYIAQKYLPAEIAKSTEEFYRNKLRESCESAGLKCLDDIQQSVSNAEVTKEHRFDEEQSESVYSGVTKEKRFIELPEEKMVCEVTKQSNFDGVTKELQLTPEIEREAGFPPRESSQLSFAKAA